MLILSGDILFQDGTWEAALAFAVGIVGLTGIGMALARHGFRRTIPGWLAVLLFAGGVGCFLLDRHLAYASTGVTALLVVLAEKLGPRTPAPEASCDEAGTAGRAA